VTAALAHTFAKLRPDFSFSKRELARRCGWWLRPESQWIDTFGAYAKLGTIVHHALAAVEGKGLLELPEDPSARAIFVKGRAWLMERKKERSDGRLLRMLRPEVAFAYDVASDTARELADPPGETNVRWYADKLLRLKYGILPTEVCGRLDLVGFGSDEWGPFAWIADYKCHFGPDFVTARSQLEIGALAVARAWKIDRVQAVGVHIWEEARENETGVFEEWIAEKDESGALLLGPSGVPELGAGALDAIAVAVRDELGDPDDDETPNPGPHCADRYCQAAAACPATLKAATSALSLVPAERLARGKYDVTEPTTSNDQAAWFLVALDLLEKFIEAKKAEVRAFADAQGGIVDHEGGLYSGKIVPRELPMLIGRPGALEALQALGLDFAIELRTSWTAMVEAGGGGKAGEALALKARLALRSLGATTQTEGPVYKSRKLKAGAQALAKTRGRKAKAGNDNAKGAA
jgi:hypothetical protein